MDTTRVTIARGLTAPLRRLPRLSLARLLAFPATLLLAHAFGYLYATYARWLNSSAAQGGELLAQQQFPLFARETLAAYTSYLQGVARLDFGTLPYGRGPVSEAVLTVLPNTLGLLALAFLISGALGLAIGLQSARANPASVPPWLTVLSTVGLALPGFYVGTLVFALLLFAILYGWPRPELPFYGTGWDAHLVLPLVALCVRPTAQIALMSSQLLAGELRKQYVVTARSVGHSWIRIRWRGALRNIAAPIAVALMGSLRLLMGELLVVEWVFNWRGVGRLLAETLIPPRLSIEPARALFLEPPLVAMLLALLTLFFLLTELLSGVIVTRLDPRLRESIS